MSPACKLWNLIVIGSIKQTSHTNEIFMSIVKTKAHWKRILTHCLKNWMQKEKDKWPFDHLSWEGWTTPWWNDPYHAKCIVHFHGH
jgi:hypothetical protein